MALPAGYHLPMEGTTPTPSMRISIDRAAGGYRVHVFERDPGTCNVHESQARAIDLPQRPVALRSAH